VNKGGKNHLELRVGVAEFRYRQKEDVERPNQGNKQKTEHDTNNAKRSEFRSCRFQEGPAEHARGEGEKGKTLSLIGYGTKAG